MTSLKELEHLSVPFRFIEAATDNFTTFIGKGGYGHVYKGELLLSGELRTVAVKRLNAKRSNNDQGIKEFLTEIQMLSRYKHPNIVSLVGFCDQGDEKILIYEYAEHGSLDTYLNKACAFTWKQRIKICFDAACGLNYLHNEAEVNHRVIHRDIKSGNILLGHNWKAMIADLGLSIIGLANVNNSYVVSNPCGTDGYVDPEFMSTYILTKESDIYSFGVVLFEVLCGKLNYMNVHDNRRYYEEDKLEEIIDPSLKNLIGSNSLYTYSKIAYECLHSRQQERPTIATVVRRLKDALKFQENVDKGPEVTTYEGVKEMSDSARVELRTIPSKEVLNKDRVLLGSNGAGENKHERKSQAMLCQESWTPIPLPESWDEDVPMSNQSELRVLVSNLDEIFWEHVSITVNILRLKKSDYNARPLDLLDDLLIKCFSVLKKLLDNYGGGFGNSYIRHWAAIVELYKEVIGCTDASGRLLYESVACIRIIISSVAQSLEASKATKHAEVATNTLKEILDKAKDLGVIDALLSCLVTCGANLMSGSSNLLRAACETCETIWSLIHAFEIQSTKENAPIFPLSSMYSHSLDRINIKGDERGPFIGKDYEEIVEIVAQAFLRSKATRFAIFYCLRQRLEASWSSVIQIIIRCCVHNDSVASVLCGLTSSSVVGGCGDNTIISEVFSIISLCASFDTDLQTGDTNNLKSKVSDSSDLIFHSCLFVALVAQSLYCLGTKNTAVIMLTSSLETQQSRLSDLAHHYSLCDGKPMFRPHSMSAMLALGYMCSLEDFESVATLIRETVVPLIPPIATLCDYLRMSTTDAQGGKVMLSYWHGFRDGCAVLLCFGLLWGGPLAIQDIGGFDIPQSLINLLGNKQQHSDEIGLSPLGVVWTVDSLFMCLKGGSSVFRQVFLTSEHVKYLCYLISDVHLQLLRSWGGPGGREIGVTKTCRYVVKLLGFPFVASEDISVFQDMDCADWKDMVTEIKASMDKYIQILLQVGLPGQIIRCLEYLELKDIERPLLFVVRMVTHRSLVLELVGKGLLNPDFMRRLLDDSSPTDVKINVLQIVSKVAFMDEEFYEQIDGAYILQQLKAFLTHEDPHVRGRSCEAIGSMCKHSSYFCSLLARHNIISLLVDRVFDKDEYPQMDAMCAIRHIAKHSDLFYEDLRRCIPQLAKLLLSAETTKLTKIYAATSLGYLSEHSEKLSQDMISEGTMEALLKVVEDYSVVVVAVEPSKIDANSDELLLIDALSTLAKMIARRSLVVEFVGRGFLNPILMKRLLDDSSPTDVKFWTLEIVSGVAKMDQEFYKQIEGANILQRLKSFLTQEDPNIRACTCRVIGEMCKHSSYFYSLLSEHNIISLLADLLFDKHNYPQRTAVFAISLMTRKSEYFYEDLRRCIHQLAKMVLSAETSNITKRNAATCLDNLSYFSDKLVEDMISKGAMEALLKVVADYSVVALDPNRIDDVKESPLDYTLEALATMCKHQPCRHFIRSSDAYSIIGQLRESPIEDIASYSTLIFNRASEET